MVAVVTSDIPGVGKVRIPPRPLRLVHHPLYVDVHIVHTGHIRFPLLPLLPRLLGEGRHLKKK